MGQQPTVGRIVHYRTNGRVYAAVVTHVWTERCVNLNVFDDGSHPLDDPGPLRTSVLQGETEYTWSWPPRS